MHVVDAARRDASKLDRSVLHGLIFEEPDCWRRVDSTYGQRLERPAGGHRAKADPSVGRQLVRVMVLMVRATTASTATVQCAVFVPIALQSRLPRKTSGVLLSTGQCGEPLRGDGRLRPCREIRVVQGRAQRRDPTVGRAQPRRGDEDTRRLRLHGVDLRMSVAPVVVPRGRWLRSDAIASPRRGTAAGPSVCHSISHLPPSGVSVFVKTPRRTKTVEDPWDVHSFSQYPMGWNDFLGMTHVKVALSLRSSVESGEISPLPLKFLNSSD